MTRALDVLLIVLGVLLFFAVGLVGYYRFSAEGEDGLEKTMSDSNVTEGEPVHEAPLSYGENYLGTFLSGILGAGLVLIATFLVLKGVRRLGKSEDVVDGDVVSEAEVEDGAGTEGEVEVEIEGGVEGKTR